MWKVYPMHATAFHRISGMDLEMSLSSLRRNNSLSRTGTEESRYTQHASQPGSTVRR